MSAGAPDFFYKEAQRLGYVARSAFKLLQIQKQYKVIKPGASVLDLGCAPGAWLQRKGFSVILSDMCPPVSGISTKDTALSGELGMRALALALGEIHSEAANVLQDGGATSYVHSDATEGVLQLGGNLVVKLLESEESQGFPQFCKGSFRKVSWLRPKATRSSSREIYLICQDLKRLSPHRRP